VRAPDTLSCVSALRAALVALSAAVLTAACAAGQQAQTGLEKPTIDGTEGSVGNIKLVDVSLHTPTGASYAAGANVPMTVYIANSGASDDTLTNITSTEFPGGWQVVSTSSLSSSASPAASPSGTSLPIVAGSAVGLGISGLNTGNGKSKQTLVLKGLAKQSAPLTPGMAVKITFTFANAGQTTLTVPVQLSTTPNEQTLPASPAPAA
jgi:copper(I)-binding protein